LTNLRAAVIGVGYLGRFHAQKYAALDGVDLVGVVDSDPERATAVATEIGTTAFTDYHQILDHIDMASVVVPTCAHYAVTRDLLAAGCHVLVEKPFTQTTAEADELIGLAEQQAVALQVGHLERFNPAVTALDGILKSPMFVESHRLTSFKSRGTDVDVVLDLMIHDIDIILSMVPAAVKRISAVGVPILSEEVDIANARIEFDNGCVANVTASRVSQYAMRKIRLFQSDAYLAIDYQKRKIAVCRKGGAGMPIPGLPGIAIKEQEFEEGDSLMAEICAFVEAVRIGSRPLVTGEDGKRALELALQISAQLGRPATV
jgi:predicted dehydrogenase